MVDQWVCRQDSSSSPTASLANCRPLALRIKTVLGFDWNYLQMADIVLAWAAATFILFISFDHFWSKNGEDDSGATNLSETATLVGEFLSWSGGKSLRYVDTSGTCGCSSILLEKHVAWPIPQSSVVIESAPNCCRVLAKPLFLDGLLLKIPLGAWFFLPSGNQTWQWNISHFENLKMIFLFEYQSIRDFHPTMLDSRRVDVVFCHFAVSRQVTLNHPYKAPVPALLAKHSWKSRVRRLPSRVWLRSSPSPHKRIETLSNVERKQPATSKKRLRNSFSRMYPTLVQLSQFHRRCYLSEAAWAPHKNHRSPWESLQSGRAFARSPTATHTIVPYISLAGSVQAKHV